MSEINTKKTMWAYINTELVKLGAGICPFFLSDICLDGHEMYLPLGIFEIDFQLPENFAVDKPVEILGLKFKQKMKQMEVGAIAKKISNLEGDQGEL